MSRGMIMWLIVGALLQPIVTEDSSSSNSDDPDIVVLMDGRGRISQRRIANDDIETRRRSDLDKNFMRFGRTNLRPFSFQNEDGLIILDSSNIPFYQPNYSQRLHRTGTNGKQDAFIRFGRGLFDDFIKFGREDENQIIPTKRPNDERKQNFIRFGKRFQGQFEEPDEALAIGEEPKRFKRGAEYAEQKKSDENLNNSHERLERSRNLIRFGRNGNFMRFGRDHPDNEHKFEFNRNNENENEVDLENLNAYLNPFLINNHQFPLWKMFKKQFPQSYDELKAA